METLLEQARLIKHKKSNEKKPFTNDGECELLFAYIKGEVTITQVATVLRPDLKPTNAPSYIYARVISWIKMGLKDGSIKIKLKK